MKNKAIPYILIAAAATAALTNSCQSDRLAGDIDAVRPAEELITISADIPTESETKTVRDAQGKIYWLPADEISLFYASGEGGGSRFTSTNEEQTGRAQFTGSIGVITGGSDENDGVEQNWFWGLYPYDASASCDGTFIYTTTKSVQEAGTGSFGDDTFVSIGRSQGLSMSFYNVCGGIGFSVTRDDIKRVVLYGNGEEALGGRLKIGLGDDGKPYIAEVTDAITEIELVAPGGGTFTAGEYYYIPTIPVSLPSGFTLELYTNAAKGVFTYDSSLSVTRSSFKRKSSADAGVEFVVQYVEFADANFEAYCLENFDTDSDGRISVAEASAVTTVNVNTDNIESLGGIEWFTELRTLVCDGSYSGGTSNGILSSLDVSSNVNLHGLWCSSNQLTALDVSNNENLRILDCAHNQLTSLDVSNNSELTELYCSSNQLTTLDVSNNSELKYLICYLNQLTSLDVSNNVNLQSLSCYYNQLTALDVSNNVNLQSLKCYRNQLTTLDVSRNSSLTSLDCSPMNDTNGNSLLATLYMQLDQTIEGINSNRSTTYIPAGTVIEYYSSEPVDDEDL